MLVNMFPDVGAALVLLSLCPISFTVVVNSLNVAFPPSVIHVVDNNVQRMDNRYHSSMTINRRSQLHQDVTTWWIATSDIDNNQLVKSDTILPVAPPSTEDITLLRTAFAEFYAPPKGQQPNYDKAYDLLSEVIVRWDKQPNDERAGLYRVRGDCNMIRGNTIQTAQAAYTDYDKAVTLLQKLNTPNNADPQEYPLSLFGRARAAKSILNLPDVSITEKNRWAKSAVQDYKSALIAIGRLSSMDDDEIYDDDDRLMEGIVRNPYAAWEWGDVEWKTGNNFVTAAMIQAQSSEAFATIGDKARSVIAEIDSGISLAAAGEEQTQKAENVLRTAIQSTVGVKSRDVELLQHVITKEGEGRMALAALLWNDGQRTEAETVLGEACLRLDQLQAQIDVNIVQNKRITTTMNTPTRLLYSIDDNVHNTGGAVLSCSDFKKPKFLIDTLGWPEILQKKVIKLEKLQL